MSALSRLQVHKRPQFHFSIHFASEALYLYFCKQMSIILLLQCSVLGVLDIAYDGFEQPPSPRKSAFSIRDIVGDGFLFAVPHHRRSIERRMKRKYGDEKYVLKILQPKTTLRVCNTCGDNHEVGVLCPTCYKRVKEETKAMQDKILEKLKLDPVDKEVVVLYEGEKFEQSEEFWQGKRIVEMEKVRPKWFSKNLTQETTQQPATTTDVKPTKLG